MLNGEPLGMLPTDEKPLRPALAIPQSRLRDGDNILSIEPFGKQPVSDDIRVGEIKILSKPIKEFLGECRVTATLHDAQTGTLLPGRFTIVDASGALPALGTTTDPLLAIRPGVVYCADKEAAWELPAGVYTITAGRGFEYSIEQKTITLAPGEVAALSFTLRREVHTGGYVACDTHLHTLTYSGHGDATVQERLVTLAGEGIELPVATDHNVQVDYRPLAVESGLAKWLTPISGMEFTTPVGHFNLFPLTPGRPVPDANQKDWNGVQEVTRQTGAQVVTLNHARDMHSKFRPFGEEHFNTLVGESLEVWPLPFDAMETVNSGATQTDPLRLFRDWMGLLNAGHRVTPVGGSDSHDVSRYIPGQARTYLRCPDADPSAIDVNHAMQSLRAGHVVVSAGLWADLLVQGRFSSGDLATAPANGDLIVQAGIRGPHWTRADSLLLFQNGHLIREVDLDANQPRLEPGVLWRGEWSLPKPAMDVSLVAIALGRGITDSFWPIAKPYQPQSTDDRTWVIGCSGAVFVDADSDGRWSSPRETALTLMENGEGQLSRILPKLEKFDAAVAVHLAHLYRQQGGDFHDPVALQALQSPFAAIREGFQMEARADRDAELARAAGLNQ
jgi:hypothetical protein